MLLLEEDVIALGVANREDYILRRITKPGLTSAAAQSYRERCRPN